MLPSEEFQALRALRRGHAYHATRHYSQTGNSRPNVWWDIFEYDTTLFPSVTAARLGQPTDTWQHKMAHVLELASGHYWDGDDRYADGGIIHPKSTGAK